MKLLVFIVALCLVHFGLAVKLRKGLNPFWEAFKAKYQKVYKDQDQETIRRTIYETHVTYVTHYNLDYGLGKHSHAVGINEYADWSIDEKEALLGFHPPPESSLTRTPYVIPVTKKKVKTPTKIDWRSKGAVTAIGNQLNCSSDYAYAVAGSLEAQLFLKKKSLVPLSVQNIVDCSQPAGNEGCNGGTKQNAFRFVKDHGIDTDVSNPYLSKTKTCSKKPGNSNLKTITNFLTLPKGDETGLMNVVGRIGPVAIGIDARHSSFYSYQGGLFYDLNCTKEVNHAVLVVGYGIYRNQPMWLVKNSWGVSWGMQGYFMMPRNKDNFCGVASYATYPVL